MKNNTEKILTGNIKNKKNQQISFVIKEFQITFINTDIRISEVELTPNQNGYIMGHILNSDKYKAIAIYVNKPITVKPSKDITLLHYILLKTLPPIGDDGQILFPGFQGITFVNGSIMSVNPCCSLREDTEKTDELNKHQEDKPNHYFVYRFVPNDKHFSLTTNNTCVEWHFSSTIKQHASYEQGCSIENNESTLTLQFSEKQELITFYNYYGYVTTFLSYLTFRVAAPYEKILLLYKDSKYGLRDFAECYINNNWSFWSNEYTLQQKTTISHVRKPHLSLTIHELSDESFSLIMHSIIKDNNAIGLPIAIIPQNDFDALQVTPNKIKTICSMIEIEVDAQKIGLKKNAEFNKLIKEVKDIIKSYKENDDTTISTKTYDKLFGSIAHWGNTLSDRTIEAWHLSENILGKWLEYKNIIISDENIERTVQARNNLTHRGFQLLDENIYTTTIALLGLAYVLSLKRMKICDVTIYNLITKGSIC